MRPPLFILCFYRTGRYPAHPPQLGRKAGQTVPMPVQGVGMPPPPLKPCAAALRGEIWCGCDGGVSLPSGCASCCQRTPGRVSRARIFRFMPTTAGLLMPRSSRPKSSKFRINETGWLEMSRNVQSGNTQNLKSMVIQRSFPKWSVAERRKTAAASDQAAVCACAHSRYFAGGSPSGLRV